MQDLEIGYESDQGLAKRAFPNATPCGFTLIELLVVIAILAILSAILFPVFASAKKAAKKSQCLSQMRQIGIGFQLYLGDTDDRLPDRKDLKNSLPGGYRPWATWPPSDPRSGWAVECLAPYLKTDKVWECPGVAGSRMGSLSQVKQRATNLWIWRFDRQDAVTPLDNFWGKTPDQAFLDLIASGNPQAGNPNGLAEVELLVDPYFPASIPTVASDLKGLSVHEGGRNRIFLDTHAKWQRDSRLTP